jgi:tetratricopeptide (TPR) repeat protein
MNTQEKRFKEYYTGILSADDKAVFEKELASNSVIQKEYSAFILTYEAEERLIAQDLRSKMKKWQEQPPVFNEDKKETNIISISKKSRFAIWQIAAAFIGLVGVIGLMWNYMSDHSTQTNQVIVNVDNDSTQHIVQTDSLTNKSNENPIVQSPALKDKIIFNPVAEPEILAYANLANEIYDEPSNLYSNLKSDNNENSQNEYTQSLQLFKRKEYKKALTKLGSPTKNEESNIAYLRGHIYFNLKDYNAAIKYWEPITKDDLLPHYNEARWYLLLAYTAQLPKSKTKWDSIVNELSNDLDFDYKKELVALISKVNQ